MQAILPDWWVDFQSKINQTHDVDEQEKLYRDGLRKLPDSAPLAGNYALFLKTFRKDYDQAEHYYQKALASDPNHAIHLGNYGIFLKNIRKDYDQAEHYYQKALASDPNHANTLGNYALFLQTARKDYDQAERYYQKALASDPNHVNILANYAGILLAQGRIEEGGKYLAQAFRVTDDRQDILLELWFYTLAHFPDRADDARQHIHDLLEKGIRSIGWDFSANIDRAQMDGCVFADELRNLAKKITTE